MYVSVHKHNKQGMGNSRQSDDRDGRVIQLVVLTSSAQGRVRGNVFEKKIYYVYD